MTDTQLYFAVGLPCLTIIASLIISLIQLSGLRNSIKDLREDMREMRDDMRSLRTDMYALRTEVNTKMDMLLAKFYEHDTDIARLKDKTGL